MSHDQHDRCDTAGRNHRRSHDHSRAVNPDADRRYLSIALALLLAFMTGEVIAGLIASSLALISDAGQPTPAPWRCPL